MQKLFVQVGSLPARLAMCPDIGAPPQIGDQVRLLPNNQIFQVTAINSTGISDPLFQNVYVGTLIRGSM